MTTASATITVQNRLGMHARPAMLFAEAAGRFSADITVSHAEAAPVDAKSIMQLMMLAATKGTSLLITAEGDDANEAVDELASLVQDNFNE
ncbi:MAG: HPr family phosphocarrier protein [Planctomycetota bacterium]|nr:HPr family phosphocarrier protein [Planctomycetota bacterium]